MTSRASFGRLKLVLRLELPLPGPRPGVDDRPPCVPALENDVRREGGPDPPPVAPVLLTGDIERMGETGEATRPFRSSDGMSAVSYPVSCSVSVSISFPVCVRVGGGVGCAYGA